METTKEEYSITNKYLEETFAFFENDLKEFLLSNNIINIKMHITKTPEGVRSGYTITSN